MRRFSFFFSSDVAKQSQVIRILVEARINGIAFEVIRYIYLEKGALAKANYLIGRFLYFKIRRVS